MTVRAAWRGSRLAGPRAVLLGATIVIGVLLGLVSMHTFGLHGTSAQTSATVAVDAGDHRAMADASAHNSTQTSDSVGCVGCGDGHVGLALMCVFVLLAVALFLLLPRLLQSWDCAPTRAGPSFRPIFRILSRAPSLHVLCISRT